MSADLVIIDSSSEIEALAKLSPRLYVVKNGEIIVERNRYETTIHHAGGTDRNEDIGKLLLR